MTSYILVHSEQTAHKSIGDKAQLKRHEGSNSLANVPFPFEWTAKKASSQTAGLQGKQMVCNVCGTVPPNHEINNTMTISNITLIRISLLKPEDA